MRFIVFLLPLMAYALEFKVATYIVENLFDAKKEGNEYQEYMPGSKHGWDEAMVEKKIANLARVVKDMDADIIALAEIENKEEYEFLKGNKELEVIFSQYLK